MPLQKSKTSKIDSLKIVQIQTTNHQNGNTQVLENVQTCGNVPYRMEFNVSPDTEYTQFSRTAANLLTPNDHYSGRTAPLTSKRCILYIYSTNTGTECFKHGIYCPFFPPQNAVCFIILTYFVSVLFTFYIQDVLKFKKIIPVPKG